MSLKHLALLIIGVFPASAQAARQVLEPQNRVHGGLSLTGSSMLDASSFGATLGFDSRMTRMLFVDLGGFVSPAPLSDMAISFDDPADSIFLRHGLYVAPGLRVPHRVGEGLIWDVMVRGGFAGVWWTDVTATETLRSDEYLADLSPAALVGLDALVRKGKVGGRVAAKGYGFLPFSQSASDSVRVIRPQITAEAFYQW